MSQCECSTCDENKTKKENQNGKKLKKSKEFFSSSSLDIAVMGHRKMICADFFLASLKHYLRERDMCRQVCCVCVFVYIVFGLICVCITPCEQLVHKYVYVYASTEQEQNIFQMFCRRHLVQSVCE